MGLHKREYRNYREYVAHQVRKLDKENVHKNLSRKFKSRMYKFMEKFKKFVHHFEGDAILCLGARLGDEVLAFRNLGFPESVGIDLNPGPDNQYVIKGDFHDIPFENASFQAVFTNSLDHAWDLKVVSKEAGRVLKKDGIFICDVPFAFGDHIHLVDLPSDAQFESIVWDGINDFIGEFGEHFTVIEKMGNREKGNHHVILVMKKK